MCFIYKLEVSNSGKEKVILYLATKLAQEHPPRQRAPGSHTPAAPETSLHPLRGVLGPARVPDHRRQAMVVFYYATAGKWDYYPEALRISLRYLI